MGTAAKNMSTSGYNVPETKRRRVEREVEKIVKKEGRITTELLLRYAKDEKHPLHGDFTWNDAAAAHSHRLEEAHRLIRLTRYLPMLKGVVVQPGRVLGKLAPVRALLPTPQGFRPRQDILEESDLRARFVERKRAEIEAWCRSVVDVEELSALRQAIEHVLSA